MPPNHRSEIRDSIIRDLIDKVRKQSYSTYLSGMRLEKIRFFVGSSIDFDFPVTALVGPNGGGKSTVLGSCACIYEGASPDKIFRKSVIGDDDMNDWRISYEVIDKSLNRTGTSVEEVRFSGNEWKTSRTLKRDLRILSISRTVPTSENPLFAFRKRLTFGTGKDHPFTTRVIGESDLFKRESERILGKSLSEFEMLEVTFKEKRKHRMVKKAHAERFVSRDSSLIIEDVGVPDYVRVSRYHVQRQTIFVGKSGTNRYSEFNFGSGESSVLRMVVEIESAADGALVLIEEIENGLHPLAVYRMVDYLIDAAQRKKLQIVFTTHSDQAIAPLPSEGIWACIDGKLQQGRLSIDALRAISGRVDKRLVIFVEDEFAAAWITAVVREKLESHVDEIGVYAVNGDSHAIRIHLAHRDNPSVGTTSLCFLDGDSKQNDNLAQGIHRLPGDAPEATVFNGVLQNLDQNIAVLTAACQRSLTSQTAVADLVKSISHTNRDPHLLFSQIGSRLGLLPEATIRGAFLSVWVSENPEKADAIAVAISNALTAGMNQGQAAKKDSQ